MMRISQEIYFVGKRKS